MSGSEERERERKREEEKKKNRERKKERVRTKISSFLVFMRKKETKADAEIRT